MSLHRFFGIKKYTEAAIKSHADGKPFNPNGCRGNISMLYYNDEAKGDFAGVEMAFGTSIRACNLPEFIYTINKLLDKGADINALSATNLGHVIQCSYTLEVKHELDVTGTPEIKQVEEEPIKEQSGKEDVVSETEELQANSEDVLGSEVDVQEATSKDLPDWHFAESLSVFGTKSECKIALEDYARKFGVELNRQQKFENMMKNFRAEMEA